MSKQKAPSASPALYHNGDEVANLTILHPVTIGKTRKDNSYRVRYACCEREEVLSHYTIAKRGGKRTARCRVCVEGPQAAAPQSTTVWIPEGPMRGPWATISPMGSR